MATILVTGISGFIGRAVAKAAGEYQWRVVGFDRSPKPVDSVQMVVKGDVLENALELRKLIRDTDGIIHLAGVLGTSELLDSTVDAVQVNIEAAVRVFDACREFKKPAVYITTGNRGWPSIYPITKGCAEDIALAYNRDLGTRIAVVRAMNAYGPYQKYAPVRKLVPNLIRWAMLNEPARIYGDGNQLLDPIHVDDVGRILADALDYARVPSHRGHMGELEWSIVHDLSTVFEAGTGRAVTVNEMADRVYREVRGWDVAPKIHEPMRPGEPPNSKTVADVRTLESLRWSPHAGPNGALNTQESFGPPIKGFIPLERGLWDTVAWYKANQSVLFPEEAALTAR